MSIEEIRNIFPRTCTMFSLRDRTDDRIAYFVDLIINKIYLYYVHIKWYYVKYIFPYNCVSLYFIVKNVFDIGFYFIGLYVFYMVFLHSRFIQCFCTVNSEM